MVNIDVLAQDSDEICTKFNGAYDELNEAVVGESFYGVVQDDNGNTRMWVAFGCRAVFKYCLNCKYKDFL